MTLGAQNIDLSNPSLEMEDSSKAPVNAHEFDLAELAQYFHLPINEVAVELGVCATVLKKICRKNGIKRWPHRKIKSIDTMVEALESVVPSSPEEQKQILADIETLREKRAFLEKNPNASYKSVVPKYAINAYNARLQKSGGVSKPARKKVARTSQPRSLPYKTRYRGTKSVPTYYFAEEERDAAVPDVSDGRRSLITSQDEFAAAQLLQLKDINSAPNLLEMAKAAKAVDACLSSFPEPVQEVPDKSAQEFNNYVTTLPKMRFKRKWEQEHSPTKPEQSVPSLASILPVQHQQVPSYLGHSAKLSNAAPPDWFHGTAVSGFGPSYMALY